MACSARVILLFLTLVPGLQYSECAPAQSALCNRSAVKVFQEQHSFSWLGTQGCKRMSNLGGFEGFS